MGLTFSFIMKEHTYYDKQLGGAIGAVYFGRRIEFGFTITELSEYLNVFWKVRSPQIAKIISKVQRGYGLGREFISVRQEQVNLERFMRFYSDYNLALDMQRRGRDVILEALKKLNPQFEYQDSEVEPYAEARERVVKEIRLERRVFRERRRVFPGYEVDNEPIEKLEELLAKSS